MDPREILALLTLAAVAPYVTAAAACWIRRCDKPPQPVQTHQLDAIFRKLRRLSRFRQMHRGACQSHRLV